MTATNPAPGSCGEAEPRAGTTQDGGRFPRRGSRPAPSPADLIAALHATTAADMAARSAAALGTPEAPATPDG